MIESTRQRDWVKTAIAYHRAKISLYELMIKEWQEELDALTNREVVDVDTPKPDAGSHFDGSS